jgi:TPR repeat protein
MKRMTIEHRGWAVLSLHATLAVCLIVVTLAGPAVAGPLQDGDAAYKRGDYKLALRLWLPLAEQGEADAQYKVGTMYDHGFGVLRNCVEAMKWYRKAADQSYADAQYKLGQMYAVGRGAPQDSAEAMKWYRKAADQGHTDAQYNLGIMYERGWGVPHDYAEAVKWYRKAADQGDGEAQNNLGVMYANGQGVPQDYVEAYKWYTLAASQLPEEKRRDEAVSARDVVARKMTPAQIAEAQRLATKWQPTGARPK